jgi:hypothetical protein
LDKQVVEIIGRHWLVGELFRAEIEVALPVRDKGVDLIAYTGVEDLSQLVARPIQLKASSDESFGIDRKYEKLPALLHVYVWNVLDPAKTASYALYYPEMEKIALTMGWTNQDSWLTGGKSQKPGWYTSSPSHELRALLCPFLMTRERWQTRMVPPPQKVVVSDRR